MNDVGLANIYTKSLLSASILYKLRRTRIVEKEFRVELSMCFLKGQEVNWSR